MITLECLNQVFEITESSELGHRRYKLDADHHPWLNYFGNDGGSARDPHVALPHNGHDNALISVSPWSIDGNHADPGYGYLSLVLLAYTNTVQKPEGVIFHPNLALPNMQNMRIKGKLRGVDINSAGAELVFWFQMPNKAGNKAINYACIKQPITHLLMTGQEETFEINLDIRDFDQWVCLGSCKEKEEVYDTVDPQDIVSELDAGISPYNMGFVFLGYQPQALISDQVPKLSPMDFCFPCRWPVDPDSIPQGTIFWYDIEIDYHSYYTVKRK